jgi:5-(carboxyamino)imidazole ribonucleotide synthase
MASSALPPGSTIGILGGGQLGRMLATAAARLGFKCRIFCEKADSPAFDVASSHVCAPYDDLDAVRRFAEGCGVVSFEFENVPADALAVAAELAPVHPSAHALLTTQDRLLEREFLDSLSIPVAPYRSVASLGDLESGVADIGRPAMLKTRRFGYDGKGQVRIESDTDLASAFGDVAGAPCILEGFIEFEREVSIVAGRGGGGDIVFYDLTENDHENQILKESRVPASANGAVEDAARAIAAQIAQAFDYVGVLAVEFFHCGAGAEHELLVNEIAPRVHNSGHWTLDACAASQFENHIRAIAGWPLEATDRHSDAVMINLIGDEIDSWETLAADPGTALHLYGKGEARSGRKMGHYTRLTARSLP